MGNRDWVRIGRWLRDEAGALFSTFWLVIALYGIGFWLVYSFFSLDAQFSRPLAGDVMPPEVTQHLAWALRAFSIVVGMAIIWCHRHDMPKFRWMLTGLGGLCAALLLLHAYGVTAKVMEGQYGKAAAQVGVAEKAVTSVQDQIADIDAAIDRAAADRDAALLVAQQTIDSTKDQVVGLSAADNETIRQANADKARALASYDAKVKDLEAQKKALRTDEGTKIAGKVTADNEAVAFNPLFTLMARLGTWTWNPAEMPSDQAQYSAGVIFFSMFFGLGEILMMTLFTVAYGMLLVAREHSRARAREVADEVEDAVIPDLHTRPEPQEPEEVEVQAEEAEPEPEPAPHPKAEWTQKQFDGDKGRDARDHYDKVKDLNKLRLSPDPFSGAEVAEAAE